MSNFSLNSVSLYHHSIVNQVSSISDGYETLVDLSNPTPIGWYSTRVPACSRGIMKLTATQSSSRLLIDTYVLLQKRLVSNHGTFVKLYLTFAHLASLKITSWP